VSKLSGEHCVFSTFWSFKAFELYQLFIKQGMFVKLLDASCTACSKHKQLVAKVHAALKTSIK